MCAVAHECSRAGFHWTIRSNRLLTITLGTSSILTAVPTKTHTQVPRVTLAPSKRLTLTRHGRRSSRARTRPLTRLSGKGGRGVPEGNHLCGARSALDVNLFFSLGIRYDFGRRKRKRMPKQRLNRFQSAAFEEVPVGVHRQLDQ